MVKIGLIDDNMAQNEDFIKYYAPVFKKDFVLQSKYECNSIEKIDCPIITMTGDEDLLIEQNDVTDWTRFTISGYENLKFHGNHFFADGKKYEIAETLMAYLNE
jgi:surfactin synthase thioesterase subunit